MNYIDYYDYNHDGKVSNSCQIPINGTVFKSNVFYIKADFAKNWLVREEEQYFKTRNRGLTGYIQYEGVQYEATINAQPDQNKSNIQMVDGIKVVKTGEEDGKPILEEKQEKLLRCVNGYFKVNFDKALTYKLAEKFGVTAFAVRMNEKKGKKIDLNEKLSLHVAYVVKAGVPQVYMLLRDPVPLPDNTMVDIDGAQMPAKLCRKIEERFNGMRIAVQPQDGAENSICWDAPSPWYDISQLDNLGGRRFAVYMWRGYEKKNPDVHYIYVGIAGNKDSSRNTVRDRISSEQKERPHIKVTHFRFSALQSCGKYSPAEILKTVEMQCINNFSALFPLAHYPDPVVEPVYDKVGADGEAFIIKLENKPNRFRNA